MVPLRRHDCVWGIQLGKVKRKMVVKGIYVQKVLDNSIASTTELTVMLLHEEGSDLSDGGECARDNKPENGPKEILHGGDELLDRF